MSTPADEDYSWTLDRIAMATLKSSYIPGIAENIPQRDRTEAGRPNHHPDHVYIFLAALTGVFGAQRPAAGWLAANWKKVRKFAHKEWDITLQEQPPFRSTCYYNAQRLAKFNEQVRDDFATLALHQAQNQGCLLEGPETMIKPERKNTVVGDGTVLKVRYRQKTYDRLKETGRLRHEFGLYVEGGEGGVFVRGFKELLLAVRPDNHPNSRVILAAAPVPQEAVGGEAGVAVRELEKLRNRTKGFLGLRYDGALRGVHINRLEKAGISVMSPVPKDDVRRWFAQVKCSKGQTHTLYSEGGDFVELEALDTGDVITLPCRRLKVYTRSNRNGTYRWYVDLRLSCRSVHTERLDMTKEDEVLGRNRTQRIRQHPPMSDHYKETYGRRADIESLNNNLDTTLYRHRMIVDTPEQQALVVIGFAIARNAMSAEIYTARLAAGSSAFRRKQIGRGAKPRARIAEGYRSAARRPAFPPLDEPITWSVTELRFQIRN